jgi:hypothetical protein
MSTCKKIGQVFICLSPGTPYPPPPITHCIRVFYTGNGEGGELNQREG